MSIQDKIADLRESGKITPRTIMLAVAEFVFIVVAIAILQNIYSNQYNVTPGSTIANLDEIGENAIQDIYVGNIYEAVSLNTDVTLGENEVIIRENSIIKTNFNNSVAEYIYFIVDIPSIQESFQVAKYRSLDPSKLPLTNNNTTVMCLPAEKQIYDFKNCKDKYDGKAPYTILSILEPFMYGQKDPNHSVRYEVKNDYSRKYLKVTSVSCKDNNGKDEALTMVKNFINSLGFTEGEFDIEVTGYCGT